jgi:precorrin-3B synthase
MFGVTIPGQRMSEPEPRPVFDRCPGLLAPHQAEDGLLVRIRVPGGQTSAAALQRLSAIAHTFGSDDLQLTSRANLQIRGVAAADVDRLADEVAAAGFLPSFSHERVRNIVGSPLTGLSGGLGDVRGWVAELDRGLCADDELAALPGRFLFVLDDGRGDVASLSFDLAVQLSGPDEALILVGGPGSGFRVPAGRAVDTVLGLARRFVQLRAGLERPPWHIRELAEGVLTPLAGPVTPVVGATQPALGAVGEAASVQVPLSLLTPAQVDAVARAGGGPVVLTPWRGLVVAGAASRLNLLTAAGLLADDGSAWSTVTACIGLPGCRRSAIDTRQLATALVERLGTGSPGPEPVGRLHLVGCERRCGAPNEPHLDLVAPASVEQALEQITDRDGQVR